MMAKQYANKLSDVLTAIDLNNKNFYSKLTDIQKKELANGIWLTMRYCSAVDNDRMAAQYLIYTNMLVNIEFNYVVDHPNLIWKLMAICGSGEKQYHYLPPATKQLKRDKKHAILSAVFPSYNTDELDLVLKLNDRETIIAWCVDDGYDEANEIF